MSRDQPPEDEPRRSNAAGGALFSLGRILATPGALRALDNAAENAFSYVRRHARGDWGDVGAEDAEANARALEEGARILSAYTLTTNVRLWIVTEADRSATTLLLPEEY